jgi:hypothetical protein
MPEAIREIVKQVAKDRGINIQMIAGDSRIRVAVEARNEAMYLIKARNPKKTSSSQIARWFARDHTSCMHGIASHQDSHNLPKLVGYDLDRVRERNRMISARMRSTRMSDTPEDIHRAATEFAGRYLAFDVPCDRLYKEFAEALMAERERCAGIADRRANYLSKVKGYASEVTELLTTSAAIRAESEAENRT